MSKTYISELQGRLIDWVLNQYKMEKAYFIKFKVKDQVAEKLSSLKPLGAKEVINYLYFPELCTSEIPAYCKKGEWVHFKGMTLQVVSTDESAGWLEMLSSNGVKYSASFNAVEPAHQTG